MASKPTQRSLKYLRDRCWTVCIVEKFLPAIWKFPRRIDAFGFGDLLAVRSLDGKPEIALVQTTDYSSFAKHKDKILGIPEFFEWKRAGGIVLLHGWGKRGPRGERKIWTVREERL